MVMLKKKINSEKLGTFLKFQFLKMLIIFQILDFSHDFFNVRKCGTFVGKLQLHFSEVVMAFPWKKPIIIK